MAEFLRDLGIAALGGIVAGLLSPAVIGLIQRHRRKDEEERLLRAFVERSGGRLDVPVPARQAARQAKIEEHSPVVERLRSKEEIRPDRSPGCFALSPEGRQRGRRSEQRPWWRRVFGG